MVAVSAELAEKERERWEKARARRERYEQRCGRGRHDGGDSRSNGHERTIHFRDYPFIMWDGEAPQDTGYSLFGSSAGHEICRPRLSTEECFDLLLEAKEELPESIFFWYGGRYDWDEITRQDIPLTRLSRLKQGQVVHWHGYRLSECEGKIYEISKNGISVKIFDVTGWYHVSYVAALRSYGIRTDRCNHGRESCRTGCTCACILCAMQADKDRRGEFLFKDIEEIARYMRDELALGPELMDVVRKICLDAGFDPRGWYGPSALARQLLTRNKINNYMAECPSEVNNAACYAFAGGRFEGFRGGVLGRTSTADQNSAYMHAALDLPNLTEGTWRRGKKFEPGKFAVYHLRYRDKTRPVDPSRPHPLFRRLKNGNVCWPRRVEGWYWSPEAELVKDNPDCVFIESWVFDEHSAVRPFSFVHEMFRKRLVMQDLGNPAEKAFKWALASIYGQLARAVGWDKRNKKPPKTHQIEWAGYITSKCRAEMYKLAIECGDRLVSIDTDSVTWMHHPASCVCTGRSDNCTMEYAEPSSILALGNGLGQWKVETSEKMVMFQNGVYFTFADSKWSKGKTRGMERKRGAPAVTPDMLMEAIRSNKAVKLSPKARYVTTRMALNGQIDSHGKWREHPGNTLYFGGGGKRYHNINFCKRRCVADIHTFLPKPIDLEWNEFDTRSEPHYLPWKTGGRKNVDVDYLEDVLWVDTEDIDTDDLWVLNLISNEDISENREVQDFCDVSSELPA